MATHSSILAWEIPWQRTLMDCSPRNRKELDMTQQMSMPSTYLSYNWKFLPFGYLHPIQLPPAATPGNHKSIFLFISLVLLLELSWYWPLGPPSCCLLCPFDMSPSGFEHNLISCTTIFQDHLVLFLYSLKIQYFFREPLLEGNTLDSIPNF